MLHLKDKLDDVLRETKIINNKMISMSDEASIETNPGSMEDVTFNVYTCNSDIEEYIDSRTNHTLITDLSGHGLNVARVKMVKVTLRINEMRTNIWNMYQKTCPI